MYVVCWLGVYGEVDRFVDRGSNHSCYVTKQHVNTTELALSQHTDECLSDLTPSPRALVFPVAVGGEIHAV